VPAAELMEEDIDATIDETLVSSDETLSPNPSECPP
jgi:hypothetical protein